MKRSIGIGSYVVCTYSKRWKGVVIDYKFVRCRKSYIKVFFVRQYIDWKGAEILNKQTVMYGCGHFKLAKEKDILKIKKIEEYENRR